MKNLLALCCFFLITAASAQKITNRQLIGKWNVIAIKMEGCYFDIKNDSVSFTKEFAAKFGKSDEETMETLKMGMERDLKGSYFIFNADNTIIQKFLDSSSNIPTNWQLTGEGIKQLLKVGYNIYEIDCKDGILYLTDPKTKGMMMLLEKTQ